MSADPTEAVRREMIQNHVPGSRADLESRYGIVWDTQELQRDFIVEGFLAPFIVAVHRGTGMRGSLEFQHSPRFYFHWEPDTQVY